MNVSSVFVIASVHLLVVISKDGLQLDQSSGSTRVRAVAIVVELIQHDIESTSFDC